METLERFVRSGEATDLTDINIFRITNSFSREFPMVLDTKVKSDVNDLGNSLPFRRCFVDFKKSYIYEALKIENHRLFGTDGLSVTIDSILFEEESPEVVIAKTCVRLYNGISEKYYYTLHRLCFSENCIKDDNYDVIEEDMGENNGLLITLLNIIHKIYRELCSRNYVYVETDEKIDVKFRDKATRKLNRVKYKPKAIIYISDKKTLKNEHPELSGRIISKPSYAFEVSGHWRKLTNPNHYGKNRQGDYVVEGFTWVMPCVKCADRGEVLKKIRVIE